MYSILERGGLTTGYLESVCVSSVKIDRSLNGVTIVATEINNNVYNCRNIVLRITISK